MEGVGTVRCSVVCCSTNMHSTPLEPAVRCDGGTGRPSAELETEGPPLGVTGVAAR